MKRLTIFSDIGGAITAEGIRLELSLVPEDEPITIEINSEGGVVSEACAIYNILRARKGAVFVEVVGWALSAATIVAMAGTRIRMHSNSLLMVHAPWVSTSGNASTLRKSAEVLDQVAASMRTAYTRTGKSAAGISSMSRSCLIPMAPMRLRSRYGCALVAGLAMRQRRSAFALASPCTRSCSITRAACAACICR